MNNQHADDDFPLGRHPAALYANPGPPSQRAEVRRSGTIETDVHRFELLVVVLMWFDNPIRAWNDVAHGSVGRDWLVAVIFDLVAEADRVAWFLTCY
ncbi:MAG: hypothetical protein HYY50_04545 [Candidatus Kerfeldbacteria bacterium]|nr:hypothetical protein [Candidatus Kerfeldbacteria bacterium]